jgi:hypothetical protein
MSRIKRQYRVTKHVFSSICELTRTLIVTHRRARRLAMYQPITVATPSIPW